MTPSIGLMRCTAVYALLRLTALGRMLHTIQGCTAGTLRPSDQHAVGAGFVLLSGGVGACWFSWEGVVYLFD